MQLNKNFQPGQIEQYWYQEWEKSHHFCPHMDALASSFCIHLPPPNITGTLHMGHAFGQTIMDGLTRYHRMKSDNTLWLPGADHAGIATQIVVERQLAAQNISRVDLGRDAFIEKLWEWKNVSGNTIAQQMRRIGCSVDWTREYFTMDDTCANNITKIFIQLYQEGLIYRGKRLINWDPVLGTAISDIEVESIEEESSMWYIRYPALNGRQEDVVVATTRPETMLGDVAVAVHPDDKRYAHLIGKKLELPLTGRQIEVVADEYVDPAFGTGCVKITPAHDFNDYEVGKRHETDLINVLTLTGNIRQEAEVIDYHNNTKPPLPLPSAYVGLTCQAARKKVLEDLKKGGYLVEIKPHKLNVPRGDRTGAVIEPMLTDQWFVAMTKVGNHDKTGLTLTQKAILAVENGDIRFVPENWVNTYYQWMNNIQDWCISRQLWWGHRIPAWYDKRGNIYVGHDEQEAYQQYRTKLLEDEGINIAGNDPVTALKTKGYDLLQDDDVLDTWFSSAVLPFSTLGWPDTTPEIKAFLPSSVLVTGYEILFFWVARMIIMTTHFTGKVPFKTVYIHGMVRDHDGKKMSKSEGNVIDPVDLLDGIALEPLLAKRTTGLRRPETIPKIIKATTQLFPEGIPSYGADALRLTMASYANLGRSVNFDFKRCQGYRNFCNKLWNATRFVLMHTDNKDYAEHLPETPATSFIDQWIMSRLQLAITEVTQGFDQYRFDLVAQTLYEFIWDEYCSWYLELTKVQLANGNEAQQYATQHTLLWVLENILRLMHPIMPFITEELWQQVAPLIKAKKTPFIMLASWPLSQPKLIDAGALKKMNRLKDLVNGVRHLRGEMNINTSVKVPLFIESPDKTTEFIPYLILLARLSDVTFVEKLPQHDAPYTMVDHTRLMLQVTVNKETERTRLHKEISKRDAELVKLALRLEKFSQTEKTPAHLIERDKIRQAQCLAEKASLATQLKEIS